MSVSSCPLHVGDADHVERDVDPARSVDDRGEMGLDTSLIGRVQPRRVSLPAGSGDLARDHAKGGEWAAGQEDLRTLPREGPGDRGRRHRKGPLTCSRAASPLLGHPPASR
jgi:hypothetical protein